MLLKPVLWHGKVKLPPEMLAPYPGACSSLISSLLMTWMGMHSAPAGMRKKTPVYGLAIRGWGVSLVSLYSPAYLPPPLNSLPFKHTNKKHAPSKSF